MAGGFRYTDDILRLFRNADDVADVRAVLQRMSGDLDGALRSSDPNALDDLIRRSADSSDAQVSRLFRTSGVRDVLETSRNRHLFDVELGQLTSDGSRIDFQRLASKHKIQQDDPVFKAGQRIVEAHNRELETAARLRRLEERDVLNFTGGFNRLLHRVGNKAGPFKGVIIGSGQTLLYSTAIIGAAGTAVTVGGLAHLASDGESTRAVTRLLENTVTGLYDAVKGISPEFADWLKEKSPDATRLVYTAMTLQTDMLVTSLRELNGRHNLGINDRDLESVAHVMEGNFVLGALRQAGVDIQADDVERVVRESVNSPDRKAYIAAELSRMSGRSQSELLEAMASPEVFDATNMTPEQIREMFGQTTELPAGAPGVSPGGVAATAGAPTVIERLTGAARRARERTSEVSRMTVDQATELSQLRNLSGEGLSAKFNEVVEQKGLNIMNTPTMLLVHLLDFLGNPFGWGDSLKRSIVISETVSQFGDRFGVMRQRDPQLNLDQAAPAPTGG